MSDNFNYKEEEAFVNSIIGEGTRLSGEFDLNGLLRIDGNFYGKIRTKGKVLIGKNGVAECHIFAGTVVVGGKISGDIFATERVILLSTGILIGNIKTPRIVIEEGVVFEGACEIIEDKNKFENIKRSFIEEHFSSGDFYKKNYMYLNHVLDKNNINDSIKNEDRESSANSKVNIKTEKLAEDLTPDISLKAKKGAKQKV